MGPLSSSTGRQSYKIHGLLNTTRLLGKRTLHHSWRGWSFAGQSRQAIKESMDESCCSSLGSCQYLPIKSVYSFWRTQNTLGKHFLTSVMCNMCNLQWEVHWNTFICDCRTRLRCPGGCGTWRKGLCRWPSHRWDRVPPLEFNRIRRSSHTTIYIRSGGLIQFNPDSFGLGKTYCFGLRRSLPIQQYIYIYMYYIIIYWFVYF